MDENGGASNGGSIPESFIRKVLPLSSDPLKFHSAEHDGMTVLNNALLLSNKRLKEMHDAARAARARCRALDEELREGNARHTREMAELERAVVEHQRVHAELVAERDALRDAAESARAGGEEHEEARARAVLRMRGAMQTAAALRGRVASLRAEWAEAREQAAALPARMEEVARLVADAVAARMEGRTAEAEARAASAERERAALQRRCDEAEALRRKLHNDVQQLRGNLRVVCRVRPLSEAERARGEAAATVAEERAGSVSVMSRQTGRQSNFDLSSVLGPSAGQADVFAQVDDLVVSCLDGYNVCVLAYGQTGSGKTHTMEGPRDSRGVSHRALQRLFAVAAEREADCEHTVTVSMLEVYNEAIYDLLGGGGRRGAATPPKREQAAAQARTPTPTPPPRREQLTSPSRAAAYEMYTGEGGIVVRNLSEIRVRSKEEAAAVIAQGQAARAMAATGVHDRSSRSHCVITVQVTARVRATGSVYRGKLKLVDLAGSECVGTSGVTGAQLQEAKNINRSLSALATVFQALSQRAGHVPYRNSKLTHLLSDSLGGQSKTLMVVCLNPGERSVSETLNSLKFAATAATVRMGGRGGVTPCRKTRDKIPAGGEQQQQQ